MWSLLAQGSTATVTVRSVYAATCPVDGWLTVNAGQRAADRTPPGSRNPPPCRVVPAPAVTLTRGPSTRVAGSTASTASTGSTDPAGPVSVPDWSDYVQAADGSDFDPELGLLAAQLSRAHVCATAVGPGAAIALADSRGRTAAYAPYGTDLTATVRGVVSSCPLTVVDAGSVRAQTLLPVGERPNGIPDATQLATVDARVGQVLAATPAGATVLLVGLADSSGVPHLRVLAMRGRRLRPRGPLLHVHPPARPGPAHRHHAHDPGPGGRAGAGRAGRRTAAPPGRLADRAGRPAAGAAGLRRRGPGRARRGAEVLLRPGDRPAAAVRVRRTRAAAALAGRAGPAADPARRAPGRGALRLGAGRHVPRQPGAVVAGRPPDPRGHAVRRRLRDRDVPAGHPRPVAAPPAR